VSGAARILVVDDDAPAREAIEALLHVDPYDLTFASNGEEALRQLDAQAFDLVICDVMMPGLDGIEVCRRLKIHPEWRYVPILLLTCLDGADDLVRGIEAGGDEFLTKPVERAILRAKVRALLRIRCQFRDLRAIAQDVDALRLERRERAATEAGLSARERAVLDLLLLGRNHAEIGSVLGISARTAKFHQANILKKLGADSRADLPRLLW
jgi:DNA-binding NarL/FixJ family response regulator